MTRLAGIARIDGVNFWAYMKGFLSQVFGESYHKYNHKIRTLAVLLLFVPILAIFYKPVSGATVLDVNTKINFLIDNKTISFESKKNILEDALKEKGIFLNEKDITLPSRNSEINGGEINVQVKRARSYLLNDDGKSQIIFSAYDDTEEILKQNNIVFHSEDRISTEIISDFFSDNSLGQKIILKRAPIIYITVDGTTREIRSWLNTLGEVLKEQKVLIGDKDKVNPGLESYVVNGLATEIIRVAESEAKENVEIPYETQTIEDPELEYGRSYVKQEGKKGLKEVTYKITAENGIMVSKVVLAENLVSTSQDKIVIKGIKPFNAGDLWPIIVRASETYGISALRLYEMMLCESGGNPYSTGNGVYGLFQYNPDTWSGASAAAGYAGASIYNPTAQIYVTAWKAATQGWGAWPSCGS
ncbi:MAG: G5 domain-containing protein [Patescibacteria group bacterium]|nr:G5 domain-containing protein [Patescibacteria group bacterium]MCL5094262.1 G5 domain-containing protein [Patescibacteria group bacterium]